MQTVTDPHVVSADSLGDWGKKLKEYGYYNFYHKQGRVSLVAATKRIGRVISVDRLRKDLLGNGTYGAVTRFMVEFEHPARCDNELALGALPIETGMDVESECSVGVGNFEKGYSIFEIEKRKNEKIARGKVRTQSYIFISKGKEVYRFEKPRKR